MNRLAEAFSKADRAEEHILNLQEVIDRLPDRYSSVVVYSDGDTSKPSVEYSCDSLELILRRFSLICGDALHNLRASLDYGWVVALTVQAPSLIDHNTKFPVRSTAKHLRDALERAQIYGSAPVLFKWITADIKPYGGGNDFLVDLNELNNRDKHRMLLPIVNSTGVSGFTVADSDEDSGRVALVTRIEGANTFYVGVPAGLKIKKHGKISVSVFFDKELRIGRRNAIVSFTLILREVRRVLHSLEQVI